MNVLRHIWAKVTGRRIVYLMDHDGEVNARIEYRDPFGAWAYRHRNDGRVRLHADGTCESTSYVMRWLYANGTTTP